MADLLFSVKNKVILVTGSGGAIGGHIASALAGRGGLVYGIDIAFPPALKARGKNLFEIKCDIADSSAFDKVCRDIFNKHRRIDVLINCAGVTYGVKNGEPYPREQWDKTLAINLTAPFRCCQVVFRFMIKNNSGSIINITSLGAERGFPNNPAYGASKGGLRVLTQCLARDWGKLGIRVNNVVPGYMGAGMTLKVSEDKNIEKLRAAGAMLGRIGSPKELIGAVVFLASEASSYVTGVDIHVDGGWLANGLIE